MGCWRRRGQLRHLFRWSHPVSDPAYRADQPRFAALVAELPAQVADMHFNEVLVHGPFIAPDLGQEGLAGPHPARRAGQRFQQVEFCARQLEFDAVQRGSPGPGLDDEGPVPENIGEVRVGGGPGTRDGSAARVASGARRSEPAAPAVPGEEDSGVRRPTSDARRCGTLRSSAPERGCALARWSVAPAGRKSLARRCGVGRCGVGR